MPTPAQFVRVTDKRTGHEYSVLESRVQPDFHEVVKGTQPSAVSAPPRFNVGKTTKTAVAAATAGE